MISFKNQKRSAFTLVELLVVIGIIALLISILLPALSRARTMARRTQDLSNIKQIAVASVIYAGENKGYWPMGDRNGPDLTTGNDDLVWINSTTFGYILQCMTNTKTAMNWMTAPNVTSYVMDSKLQKMLACVSMQDSPDGGAIVSVVGETWARGYYGGETQMGFIYWGRRAAASGGTVYDQNGNAVSPTVTYTFPLKQGGPATSQVLACCRNYAGPVYGANYPHANRNETYLNAGNVNSPGNGLTGPTAVMQGLCFAYTDGSARWVPRKQLWSMEEGGFEWVYFDKTRP